MYDVGACLNAAVRPARTSVAMGMGRGYTSPQYLDRGYYHESNQVKLSSFDDFIAFYFTIQYIFYFNVDKEASASGRPVSGL